MRHVKVTGAGAVRKQIGALMAKVPDIPGRTLMRKLNVPKPLRRVLLFSEVSISAWLIDTTVLLLLLKLGLPVFMAACLSPLPALLWSFTLSTYKIYFRAKGFSRTRFGYYVAFNTVVTVISAWLIHKGVLMGHAALLMKIVVSPLVFCANFFVVRRLLHDKKAKIKL